MGFGFASGGNAGFGSSWMASPKRWSNGLCGNSSDTAWVDMSKANNTAPYLLNTSSTSPSELIDE